MFTLPPLPFAEGALAPVISANTLGFHYGKHHKAYVDNLNNLVKGGEFEGQSLEAIIKATAGKADKAGVFNNAAQVWNHTFYWNCLKPNGGGKPSGRIAQMIDSDLGGYDKFKADFVAAGTTQFGSGWAWVSVKDGKLAISKTPNGENPLVHGAKPILGVDVWEHSYYIDYRNARPKYLEAFVDSLINWDYVLEMYEAAKG